MRRNNEGLLFKMTALETLCNGEVTLLTHLTNQFIFFFENIFFTVPKHKKCYPSYLVMGTVNIFRNFLSFFDRPLMVLVQKITYVAFSVHDGMYSESW